jgi:hypothetical protein
LSLGGSFFYFLKRFIKKIKTSRLASVARRDGVLGEEKLRIAKDGSLSLKKRKMVFFP